MTISLCESNHFNMRAYIICWRQVDTSIWRRRR